MAAWRVIALLTPSVSWLSRLVLLAVRHSSQREGSLDVHPVPLGLLVFIVRLVIVFILRVAVVRRGVQGGRGRGGHRVGPGVTEALCLHTQRRQIIQRKKSKKRKAYRWRDEGQKRESQREEAPRSCNTTGIGISGLWNYVLSFIQMLGCQLKAWQMWVKSNSIHSVCQRAWWLRISCTSPERCVLQMKGYTVPDLVYKLWFFHLLGLQGNYAPQLKCVQSCLGSHRFVFW